MSDESGQSKPRKGRRYYLSRRRTASHAAAESQAIDHPDVPDHPLVATGDPTLVTTQEELARAIDAVRAADRVGYDTEFIGETSYFPHLCLIQLATTDEMWVIDPLAGRPLNLAAGTQANSPQALDLSPVWDLLADPSVVKVVHAGDPDIEPAVRLHNVTPAGLFDTQIAAGFVGLGYPVSLRQLISDLLDHELAKALTFTRWDQRPLSAVHLRYAADDVRYLCALREVLMEKLRACGRVEWAEQEFAALEDPRNHHFDAAIIVERLRRRHRLPASNVVVLRRLIVWRDRLARRRNLPPRSVMQDKVLVAIARAAPSSVDELGGIEGLPRNILQWQGRTIAHTVRRAMQTKAWHNPPKRLRPLTPRQRERVDQLWDRVKARCDELQLAPTLLTSRREVARLATIIIRQQSLPANHRLLVGWRRQVMRPIFDEWGVG